MEDAGAKFWFRMLWNMNATTAGKARILADFMKTSISVKIERYELREGGVRWDNVEES